MPTQQHDRRAIAAADTAAPGAESGTMRFRAATLEEAIAVAEQSLGTRVRVVAANRIRRGGIGGFFAADLGVEVTVALDEETIEQALERLVAETAAEERAQWTTRPRHADAAPPVGAPPLPPSVAPTAPRPGDAPQVLRVEQIIEELQALTAAPLFGDDRVRPTLARMRRPETVAPAAFPAPIAAPAAPAAPVAPAVAAPAVAAPAPASAPTTAFASPATFTAAPTGAVSADAPVGVPSIRLEPVRPPAVTTPPPVQRHAGGHAAFPPSAAEVARAAAAAAVEKAEAQRREAPLPAVGAPAPGQPPVRTEHPLARPGAAPSQRQVELAIAAADQLIESLKHDHDGGRLSVRVVLRTGDQREVEAAAEWEAP